MCRLGSTAARLKLKGIDGGPHKRWSMWFNSTQREEPYLGLTCAGNPPETGGPLRSPRTGAAWLSSARVVRCWVKSRNERNPHPMLPAGPCGAGHSWGTARASGRKVGMTSSRHGPYAWGYTHATMDAQTNGYRSREVEAIRQRRPQLGLQAATRLHEREIASNRRSAKRR